MPWVETQAACSPEDIFPGWFLDHWSALALSGNEADPFCCGPCWNLAYHHVVNSGRRLFFEASSQGAILFGEHFNSSGERMLVPIEDSWLYCKPLLGFEAPFLLAAAMQELQEGHNSVLFSSGVQPGSPDACNLFRRFSSDYDFYRNHADVQRSASLAGGLDGWLSRRSPNTRANLRKAASRAGRIGIRFERVRPDSANCSMVYERMLDVERKSWKGIGHCGMLEQPSCELYRTMLAMLALRSEGLVIFATLDGEDIGFIFGGLHGPYYRGQQFSYDTQYAHYSVGNLLQREKIAWLSELGCKRYDMGPATGPRMEYKGRWTEQRQEFQTWIMVPKS